MLQIHIAKWFVCSFARCQLHDVHANFLLLIKAAKWNGGGNSKLTGVLQNLLSVCKLDVRLGSLVALSLLPVFTLHCWGIARDTHCSCVSCKMSLPTWKPPVSVRYTLYVVLGGFLHTQVICKCKLFQILFLTVLSSSLLQLIPCPSFSVGRGIFNAST